MKKQNPVNKKESYRVSGEPFPSVQSAWFWFASAWKANQDGARYSGGNSAVERPCEPIDILCAVDRLIKEKKLTSRHLNVLTYFGSIGKTPKLNTQSEKSKLAHTLWTEAMRSLETLLIEKGIVSKDIVRVVK